MTETAPNASPRVAAVVLNWRRPDDTLTCFASVAALDYGPLDIILCDNDSGDGSFERIGAGVEAMLPAVNAARTARGFSTFAAARLGPGEAPAATSPGTGRLLIVQTGRNGGYAFGNNIGIRLAVTDPAVAFAWVLNNDTEVAADALGLLIGRMVEDPSIGLCGATVRYRGRAGEVQSLGGGRFLPGRARCEQVGEGLPADAPIDQSAIEAGLSYINGAAVLARRTLLEQVGLMDEGYFLYWEELDWATRMRADGRFRLGYCAGAIVWHQVGAATGSSDHGLASPASIYWMTRSRFRYLRLHHPRLLALATPLLAKAAAREVLNRRWARAGAMLTGALGRAP